MIVYNVTVKIDHSVHDEWFEWMKAKHIPAVLATGYFVDNKMLKVLIDEEDGVTYSIQYRCNEMKDLHAYTVKEAPALQKEHAEKYKDKFVAFRTLLEEI